MMTTQNLQARGLAPADTGRYVVMILLGIIFFFPILFMVISSLKPSMQILQDSASLRAFLPVGELSFQNYIDAFQRAPIARFIFNSIVITAVTLILGLFVNSLAGFSIACLRWKGKGIVLTVIIATFILPFEVIAVPLLLIVSRLPWIGADDGLIQGWLNSYHVQIIPFIADPFSIFLFVQFFRALPGELIEAARIDGANWFKIYQRVILPVSGPVIATVAILQGLKMWNQYLWPIMVVQAEEYRPVIIGLDYFFQLNVAWGEVMAYLSLITIPILILFLSLQRVFVESIASSGIKG
jgi:multiple sugar transport system permease protein